jgi:hypothetical protein
MTSIREIFTTFGPEYLKRYATAMPTTHRKVIDAIITCRTEACGIAPSTNAIAAPNRNSSFAPVVIAIVPPANTVKPNSGCKNRSSANSQDTIFS